jgi:hypothetical protein
VPALFRTLGLDELAAVLGHVSHQDRFSPLGTPDEVVDDEVDPMFIALIFHVEIVGGLNGAGKSFVPRKRARALRRNPPHHRG